MGSRLMMSAAIALMMGWSATASAQGARSHDFDGDTRGDIAFWRGGAGQADTGTWYIRQGGNNYTSAFSVKWGVAGDTVLVGDFDADGRLDLAAFRNAGADAGTWYISQGGTIYTTAFSVKWGVAGDLPVAGDFDADGRIDLAVYRPGGPDVGTWYILQGGSGFTRAFSARWGSATDTPAPADYDGDTRLDIAFYRGVAVGNGADTGTWYVLQNNNNAYNIAFSVKWGGTPGDVPVAGDYDGDGRTDIAFWRGGGGLSDTGTWYIRQAGNNYNTSFSVKFGVTGDTPVPGYYDNDTRIDLAVYKNGGTDVGTWYVLQAGTSFSSSFSVLWGGKAGDVPLFFRERRVNGCTVGTACS